MGVERPQGLYLPNGTFESTSEIKRKLALQGQLTPHLETPLPVPHDFGYWSNRFEHRATEYGEAVQRRNNVTITFPPEKTILNFIPDLHVGSPEVSYKRIQQEAEVIVNTPNSYVIGLGDWIDGFFFNPAQFGEIEQAPEQFAYMKALLDYYAKNKRLLVAFGGDHDLWANKAGSDPYADFSQRTGAYYMQGVGYITCKVGNIDYKVSAAHRHNGFSIYNKAHAAIRLYRDGAEGADVCVTAHMHQKAYHRQAVKEFGGSARMVDFISLGAYKSGDEYLRKKGFADQVPEEMYGQSIILDPHKKEIIYFDDILKANG